jgi:chloramphenicol O-acetyltransferase
MVTFFKTLDVTILMKISKMKKMKLNMLLDFCIGKAAVSIKRFYILPVGEKLMKYDHIAVNTIVTFMIWGRYRRKAFRYDLPVSFQFHHTQMDGAHAGQFLRNLQDEINRLKL